MKAFVSPRYGSPDVMEVREVDVPATPEDGVLVRVRAASVNALDWHYLRGKPYLMRMGGGLRTPKTTVLGVDVAGTVEAVGSGVTHLKVGDEVFGSRQGAFAEYVAGVNFVPMPAGLSFEQAAAIPTAGLTALQGLRDKASLQAGHQVLINGAGGGVGTFAVQVARALGAEVTAVTSTENVELAHALGAEEVVDYTKQDFAKAGKRYDVIVDNGGNRSLSALKRVLTPNGIVVMVAPGPGDWVGPITRMVGAVAKSKFSSQKIVFFLASVRKDDLLCLKEMAEAGKVTPVVDRTYPFEQIPDAIRYVETGKAKGKVVIQM